MGTPGAAGAGGQDFVHFEDTEGNSYDIPAGQADRFRQLMRDEYVQLIGEPELSLPPLPPGQEDSPPRAPGQSSAWDKLDNTVFGPLEPDPDAGTGAYDLHMPDRDAGNLPNEDAGIAGDWAGVDAVAGASALSPLPAPMAAQGPARDPARDKALAASLALVSKIDSGDRTVGQGRYSPAKRKIGPVETALRSHADTSLFGLDDTVAGLYGMAGHLGIDRAAGRGVDAPLQPFWQAPIGDAFDVGDQAKKDWEAENQEAFEQNPVSGFLGALPMNVLQAVLLRKVAPAATGAEETAQAAARSSDFISRTAQGAIDALVNPGNVASAAASGVGHATGDTPLEHAQSAERNFLTEYLGNAVMSLPAEVLLQPGRWLGHQTAEGLRSLQNNPKAAHLHRAAENAGAKYETFRKSAGKGMAGHPYTSGRGLVPGEDMQTALRAADERGIAQPVERVRMEAADRVARTLDTEAQRAKADLRVAREKEYPKPEAGASSEVALEVLRSAPADLRKEIVEKMRSIEELRKVQGRPSSGMDAEMLDQIIDYVDDWGNTHRAQRAEHAARPYEALSAELHKIRQNRFKGATWIAETHADKMREHEARKTQFGIPANTKGVDSTAGGEHSQMIERRLAQGQPARLLDTIRELETSEQAADRETGQLLRQWSGMDAQQRLLLNTAEEVPPINVRNTTQPVGISTQLLDLVKPGMRVAGLENLGLNAQAGVRGALTTPPILDHVYRWLGFRPDNETTQR